MVAKTSWKEKLLLTKSETDWHGISIKVYNRRSQLTKQEQVKLWRQLPKVKQLLDILKKTGKPELFREDEKNFYWEKKTITRIGYLKEQIDIDFEKKEENRQKENQFWNKKDKELAQPCEDTNLEVFNSGILNFTFKSTASSVVRFEEENLPNCWMTTTENNM